MFADSRMGPAIFFEYTAGSANITVEMSPGTTPSPNNTSVGIRYTNVGSVCMRSSTGRRPALNLGLCAAAMPVGMQTICQPPFNELADCFMFQLRRSTVLQRRHFCFRKIDDLNVHFSQPRDYY